MWVPSYRSWFDDLLVVLVCYDLTFLFCYTLLSFGGWT